MRFKRLTSAALAAAIAVPAICIYAYAEEDKTMKTALTYVKQRIDIPESYTDFHYTTSPDNGKTQYVFTWNDKNSDTGDSITAAITGKVIKSVSVMKFSDRDWKPSFAQLSDEQILKAAKKYAKEINPTINSQVDFRSSTLDISLYGEEATVKLRRTVNGALVKGQNGRIVVNKNTGELISYSFNWIVGAGFSGLDGAIGKKTAKKAFQKAFPVELVYKLSYDWENQQYVPHLIYRQTETGFINAFTGELSKYEDYEYYSDNDDYNSAAIMASKATDYTTADIVITAEEMAEINKNAKFVSAEKTLSKLRNTGVLYIPETSVITGEQLSYDETAKVYVNNVSFTANREKFVDLNGDGGITPVDDASSGPESNPISGSFSFNAETGELLSFSCPSYDTGTDLTDKAAKKAATNAMKKLLISGKVNKFSSLEITKTNDRYEGYDPQTAAPIGDPRGLSRTFTAYREVNGIKCADDSVVIGVSNTGYVTSYTLKYHNNVKFPSSKNKISKSTAYSKFFAQTDFGMMYRCAYNTAEDRIMTALVYTATGTMYIDALTGKLVNDDGSEITAAAAGEYTDLEDSKYKEYAEKLATYGVRLMDSNGKLNAGKAVTFGDFNALLSSIGMYYSIDKDETIKDSKKLTRQLAAKIAVGARFGKEAPAYTSVFKPLFDDVSADSSYLGYIALADVSGMITGSGGKFDPTGTFTRGDALMLVYNYLAR